MTNYLVQYGRSAFVGRFPAAFDGSCARGDRVVVRGPRGLELGTVLCEPADRFARLVDAGPPGGELVRPATGDDEAAADRLDARGQTILAAAQDRADDLGLSLALVDVEMLLDGTAVLHGLPWGEVEATPLFEELSERFGLPVRLLDLSRTPTVKDDPEPAAKGCGKPGCGTGGCSTGSCGTGGGCSTGSCSKGKVKGADELTAYFRDLRTQMEAETTRRTPLG